LQVKGAPADKDDDYGGIILKITKHRNAAYDNWTSDIYTPKRVIVSRFIVEERGAAC
jgi:hypothetical protein